MLTPLGGILNIRKVPRQILARVLWPFSPFVVSHTGAILGYLDFVGLMAATTWVESTEEMEPLLPTQSERWRSIGRFIRNAL